MASVHLACMGTAVFLGLKKMPTDPTVLMVIGLFILLWALIQLWPVVSGFGVAFLIAVIGLLMLFTIKALSNMEKGIQGNTVK